MSVPKGLDCSEPGVLLETLPVRSGYWRPTNTTIRIRECLYEKACEGGAVVAGSDDYCTVGYKGPCESQPRYMYALFVVFCVVFRSCPSLDEIVVFESRLPPHLHIYSGDTYFPGGQRPNSKPKHENEIQNPKSKVETEIKKDQSKAKPKPET